MWIDEIVEEIRRIREDFAAKYNYDLEAIFTVLKEKERAGKRTLVSFPAKKPLAVIAGESRTSPKIE